MANTPAAALTPRAKAKEAVARRHKAAATHATSDSEATATGNAAAAAAEAAHRDAAAKADELSRKRDDFARFISVLTGDLGISVGFGATVGAKGARIVLPDIGSMSAKAIDFLYSLCLREVGFIAKSKRRPATVALLSSQEELIMAFAVEAGRTERALSRVFGGARALLDHHWTSEAFDPELSAAAFGYDPSKASAFQAFAQQVKLEVLGGVDYGWKTLFPPAAWIEAETALAHPGIAALLRATKPRRFEDAVQLGKDLVVAWHTVRGDEDTSPALRTGPKADTWDEVRKALADELPAKVKDEIEKQRAAKAKAKEIKDKIDNALGDSAKALAELRKRLARLNKARAPLSGLADRLAAATSERALGDAHRASAAEWDQKEAAVKKSADERAAKFGERAEALSEKFAEDHAKAEKRLSDLIEAAEKRLAALEERSRKAEDAARAAAAKGRDARREALEQKVRDLMAKLAEEQAKSAEREAELRAKGEEARRKMQDRIDDLTTRSGPTERAKEAMRRAREYGDQQRKTAEGYDRMAEESLEAARKMAEEAIRKSKSLAGMSEEQLIAHAEDLERRIAEAKAEKDAIEGPISDLRRELRDARTEGREAAKEAVKKTAFRLQELQEKLDAAGIEADLYPKRHDIDGWDLANDAQKDFDQEATEALGLPVVNGSGAGGRGNRDVLTEIALRAEGIEDIDPNDIFSDVARLSPLSGLSESGVREGAEGGCADKLSSDPAPLADARSHTIWRRDLDRIVPCPAREPALVRMLRTKHAPTIARTKALFRAKLKPSTKPRYVGGREEGDLDARAIWKLAAGTGEDFYEIQKKRPQAKAAASILVDLSGSCASWGEDANDKIQGLALALSDALTECSIEHEILGHSAPWDMTLADQKIPTSFNRKACKLETIVAKGFGDKEPTGIASLTIRQADNSDGEAVRIAANRLRRRTAPRRILFLVGDGKSFMQDADAAVLDEDLRRALADAAAQKIAVVSLGFGRSAHPVLGTAHIALDNLADLPDALKDRL